MTKHRRISRRTIPASLRDASFRDTGLRDLGPVVITTG